MAITKIYESFEDFANRLNKVENGVSIGFANSHPSFEYDNKTNTGCWNCKYCFECVNLDSELYAIRKIASPLNTNSRGYTKK